MILVAGDKTLVFAIDGLFWRNPAENTKNKELNLLTVNYERKKSQKRQNNTNVGYN